jgi:hypothetical protein
MVAGNYSEAKANGDGGEGFGALQRNLGDAKKQFKAIEERCVTLVLLSAEVVVSTCIGAGVSACSLSSLVVDTSLFECFHQDKY